MPRDSAVFGSSWIEPKPARLVEGLGRVAQWGNFGGKQCDSMKGSGLMGSVFWKLIATKLYSSVPHSITDERTMSAVTLLNTA